MSLVFARASTKEEDSAFYCSVCSGWFVASEHRLVEEPDQPQEAPKQHVPTPRQIFAGLEEHAIGQRSVKMAALSVAVHNHYQRLAVAKERERSTSPRRSSNYCPTTIWRSPESAQPRAAVRDARGGTDK